MPTTEKPVRQSVSLPPRVARRVRILARTKRTSANRILVDLIESGLLSQEQEKQRFLDVAERLACATNPGDQARLKAELARMTFGD